MREDIYNSISAIQTAKIGKGIAKGLSGGEVICFYGDLGSGKTTMISGIIKFFYPGKRVLSPTFIIVRHYGIMNNPIENIYHADLYRLDSIRSIEETGLFSFFHEPKNIVLVEWAEKLEKSLPRKRWDIYLKMTSESEREIKIIKHG